MTLNNYVWDDVHSEYNGKNQKEDNAQTYDYYDFVKIADSGVNAENIIYRFKYNEFNNEPADKFADSKADDAGWEVFLDYQNYPTDIFGNIIDNKKLDYKDTQSVTSQGNYLSIISDGYQNNYIGKYATAWSIYNKHGDRVATIPSSALLYALGKSDEQIKNPLILHQLLLTSSPVRQIEILIGKHLKLYIKIIKMFMLGLTLRQLSQAVVRRVTVLTVVGTILRINRKSLVKSRFSMQIHLMTTK